jgi:hypothetical protein
MTDKASKEYTTIRIKKDTKQMLDIALAKYTVKQKNKVSMSEFLDALIKNRA